MRHTIVTMTRGDAHKVAEWVSYHAAIGIDDFQVVLDGDVDGTAEVLRGLDVPAEVTLHLREEVGEYYDGLVHAERQLRVQAWRERHAAELASGAMRGHDALAWRQHLHFPAVMAPYAEGRRGKGWLGLVDVDEFVVLGDPAASIGDVLAAQDCPRVRLLNFNVDTTGHDPARPVLEQHSVRWSRRDLLEHEDPRWAKRTKTFVRNRLARLDSTVHKVNRGRHVVLDPETARLHHFKVPPAVIPGLPFTVDDPIAVRR